MKKTLLAIAIVSIALVSFSGTAHADKRSNTGCGLGHLVFKDSGDGLVIQVLAATTNTSFGTQTFGITTGTSECDKFGKVAQNENLNRFVSGNMENLAKDIAMGKGETLDTVAEMMNVPASQKAAVYAKLQANFGAIYTSDKVQAGEVVDHISAVING